MVIGGYIDGDGSTSVEVIDLSKPDSNCQSIADYPFRVSNAVFKTAVLHFKCKLMIVKRYVFRFHTYYTVPHHSFQLRSVV